MSDANGSTTPSAAFESTDVISIRPGEEMDWPRLISHLREQLDGLDGDYKVAQFGGGHANLTYCLQFNARELVVRRPPLGPVAKGAHDMGREYRVLSKLHAGFDRAPRAYYYCDDPDIIGAPFFVAERRHGVVARREWPFELKDVEHVERRASFALIDALADLHSLDPNALGLGELGRPAGFVERQLSGWAARWHAAKDREIPAFDDVHQELVQRMPLNSKVSILHNDYKLDNCQFQAGRARSSLLGVRLGHGDVRRSVGRPRYAFELLAGRRRIVCVGPDTTVRARTLSAARRTDGSLRAAHRFQR